MLNAGAPAYTFSTFSASTVTGNQLTFTGIGIASNGGSVRILAETGEEPNAPIIKSSIRFQNDSAAGNAMLCPRT